MKKVLVPTDSSENAKHALEYALNLFAGEEVEFTLFNSFLIPVYSADMPIVVDDFGLDNLQQELEKDAEVLKDRYASTKYSFKVIVESGSLSISLNHLVDTLGIDLVVMGTKGASGLVAAIMGSNTSDIIEIATCPVLAVPEGANLSVPKNIVFASDNQGLSDSCVITPLTDLALKYQSHIHLMNVLDEDKMTTVDEAVEGLRMDHILDKILHTFHFENAKDKAEAIEEYLNTHDIDLLAVVPRKNNFFDSIFHKSVSRKLALHTKVLLLAMRDLG